MAFWEATVFSGIKQQAIVGKDGKIEIQSPELVEGTVVEVIVLVEPAPVNQNQAEPDVEQSNLQGTTEYLLSTQANRHHLMTGIQQIETRTNLISFTPEEWDEEYHVRS